MQRKTKENITRCLDPNVTAPTNKYESKTLPQKILQELHTTGGQFIILKFLFDLFLERLLRDALDDYEGGVKCGGRTITDLRFADDIDLMDSNEEGIKEITKRLEYAASKFGMEISTEKGK